MHDRRLPAPASLGELAVELLGDRLVELGEEVAVAVERDGDRAWPMRAWIAFGWAPSAMARATLVWRRSWNRHETPAARWACLKWWVRKLDDDSGAGGVREHEAVGPGRREPVEVVGAALGRDGARS